MMSTATQHRRLNFEHFPSDKNKDFTSPVGSVHIGFAENEQHK